MEDRKAVLRQRIERCRSYLKQGADTDHAREHLRQIVADEAELARIDQEERSRSGSAAASDQRGGIERIGSARE